MLILSLFLSILYGELIAFSWLGAIGLICWGLLSAINYCDKFAEKA